MACNVENSVLDTQVAVQKLEICLEKLRSSIKTEILARVKLLKEIESLLSDTELHFSADADVNKLVENVVEYFIGSLSDESEKCREIGARVLSTLFDSLTEVEFCVPYIFNTLVCRLGKSDNREPSEEVRLLEVFLLYKVIDGFNGDLLKYLNDISNILCMCIIDEYSEIKRKSCECTYLLVQKQKTNFHMISSTFLKPLLHTISHQHFKTRAVCVRTVGSVVCYGNSHDFQEVISHIAQRLFDHSPVVRIAVTEVIGLWLTVLPDRYSFFNQLIPLMLSILYDNVNDVKAKAIELWHKSGEQYLEENETDYKDLINFPQPDPDNYPPKEKRPFIGCRILVQRNMFSILPPLIHDLSDWTSATRVKSIQVLYSIILHAEDKATMQLTCIIDGIVCGAKDEEKQVAELANQCAELLGFFLDSNLLCDYILTLINKSPSSVHLSIFAAALRGNKKKLSSKCFQAVCKLLSEPSVCRLRQAEEQANLLLCIDSLLTSYDDIDYVTGYHLFTILCTISGLTTNDSVVEKAMCLLKVLAEKKLCSLQSVLTLYTLPMVKMLIYDNELWTSQNPELPIFCFLVASEHADEEVLKLCIPIMTNNLNLNKDVKLRSNVLTLLIKVFKKLSSIQDKEISEKILSLICLGIFPNLTWAPGKAATSLRTIAVASLFEIISKNCIDESMLKAISDELLPILSTLSDDDEASNRLLSCKILESLLPKLYGCVDDYKIHSACHDFLQCMDDGSDEIRIMASKLLKSYIKAFPNDYNWNLYQSYIKEMYKNVLIHMDDKNEKVKESMFCLLKDSAFANPKLLLDEIEEKRYLMASGDYCENLIEYVKSIQI